MSKIESTADLMLRNMSAPFRGIMKFFLVYSGPLSASGNGSKKRAEVVSIREKFSKQLKVQWEESNALKQLQRTGFSRNPNSNFWQNVIIPQPTLEDILRDYPDALIPLWGDIPLSGYHFRPLVRKTLALNCDLKILFLRQGNPGALISQAGDLDNRIKTLLDALRMPTSQEIQRDHPKSAQTFCLMESDTLVSGLDVTTDRLLFPKTEFPNEVHLVVEVELKLLHVSTETICLL